MNQLQLHRSVTPFIYILRTILRGKVVKNHYLRYADQLAARTQSQPNLPGGPYAKTTRMYYFTRDTKQEIQPPILITTNILTDETKTNKLKDLTPNKTSQPI